MANEKANKVTFEQEAKIYEEKALAEIKKISGDGSEEPPDIACILQSGRRAIYMARQELASRVEVVRCKDCKRYCKSAIGSDDCLLLCVDVKPDDYCSHGERKENEERNEERNSAD